MRLVCPNCAAQYEIEDGLIPVAGRDVECGSCGHGWYQSAPAPERIVLENPASPPAGQMPPESATAPASTAALAILREEAARELAARADKTGARQPATPTADAGRAMPAPVPDPAGRDGQQQTRQDGETLDGPLDKDWPEDSLPRALPDPAPLAASLNRREPLPADAAADTAQDATAAPSPVAAKPARRAYRSGLALPLIAATLLVAAYVAAPPLAEGDQPFAVALTQFRAEVDQARLQLHGQAASLGERVTQAAGNLLGR